ncbi:hypothetical protein COU57_01140 [Candidatus Pacearchaeota archaeon CG10_big_fil_rev_8_21_14_0_10_32_14]|nr:MAG: hypothetical protein COU57_01140 [Candidatus Pacearchaeota archaeon CG10_big_fil_rev_8_21_14_0_10_32_14]
MNSLAQIQTRLEYIKQMNGSLSDSRRGSEMRTIDELLSTITNEATRDVYELMVDEAYECVGLGRY